MYILTRRAGEGVRVGADRVLTVETIADWEVTLRIQSLDYTRDTTHRQGERFELMPNVTVEIVEVGITTAKIGFDAPLTITIMKNEKTTPEAPVKKGRRFGRSKRRFWW